MSQSIELPLDTKCFLCDSYYGNTHQSFVVYKCFLCMKFTSYCMPCELILQKLFGKGNFFKCSECDKLTNALDKYEVAPSDNINLNNSFFKTPSKPFLENNVPISSIHQNTNINFLIKKNDDEEERKDNNNRNPSPKKIMLSHFLDDFKNINFDFAMGKNKNKDMSNTNFINNTFTVNNSRNNSINPFISSKGEDKSSTNLSTISNYQKINDFSLLTSKNRLNKRFCLNESLLGRKREDSENANEFRGYNKYKERQNSKINDRNPSRGKFKNLIAMKMSKVYNTNKNEEINNTLGECRNNNCEGKNVFLNSSNIFANNDSVNNNGFGFNLLRERNNINDRKEINLFNNSQKRINFNFIDGKSTPHRLTNNNSFEYF